MCVSTPTLVWSRVSEGQGRITIVRILVSIVDEHVGGSSRGIGAVVMAVIMAAIIIAVVVKIGRHGHGRRVRRRAPGCRGHGHNITTEEATTTEDVNMVGDRGDRVDVASGIASGGPDRTV